MARRAWRTGQAVRTPAHAAPRPGPNDGSSRSGSCGGGDRPASPTCSALTAALKRAVRAVSGGARRGWCGCAASEQALRALCVVRGGVDGRTEFREPGASTSVKRPAASRNVSCAAMMPRNRSAPRSYGEVTSSSPITGMNGPMEPSELLTPSPAILTDVRVGYARLSTGGQKLDRQVDALTAAGCRRIFADKKSSKINLRAELKACHAFLTPGDSWSFPPSTATAGHSRTSSTWSPNSVSAASASGRCTRRSTPPPRAGA